MKFILNFVFCLFVLGADHATAEAFVNGSVRKANDFFKEGKFAQAAELYEQALQKNPESDAFNFNLGTTYYKEKDYARAIEHLQKVLLTEDPRLKARANYNLGNALYKHGMDFEQEDIQFAIGLLEDALTRYEGTLSYDPDDKDAVHNLEFVKQEIKRLKLQQQKQQQQQQQNQQSQENKSEQSQSQRNRSRQDQSQNEQGRQPQQQDQKTGQDGQQRTASQNEQGPPEQPEQKQANSRESAQQLTKEEAVRLIENYQYTEEPEGLINLFKKQRAQYDTGYKDW